MDCMAKSAVVVIQPKDAMGGMGGGKPGWERKECKAVYIEFGSKNKKVVQKAQKKKKKKKSSIATVCVSIP